MPPAARITDLHTCPVHPPNPIVTGEVTVLIGYMPAARVSDKEGCLDSIIMGEPSVKIGNKDAARLGDKTAHGGVIVKGCPTVIIGSSPQAETLKTDKPFCEDCERAKKEREAKRKR
jgi:uncharacterized Zn-binding protein involved in type VI secretion